MPSPKRNISHRPRRSKSPDRVEDIELATVRLELKTRVEPTWGIGVEPDAYMTDLYGDILLPKDDADDEIIRTKHEANARPVQAKFVDLRQSMDILISDFGLGLEDVFQPDRQEHASSRQLA